MNPLIAELQTHLRSSKPLPVAAWDRIWKALMSPEHEGLLVAMVALSDAPLRYQPWVEHRMKAQWEAWTALDRLLFVSLEDESIDEHIDAMLANISRAPGVVSSLVRADVPWSHHALVRLLAHAEGGVPAAWLLAEDGKEELSEWLTQADEEPEHILSIWRAIALSQQEGYWELAVEWHEVLCDLEPGENNCWSCAMHASLALLNPHRYARGVLMGDFAVDWLQKSDYLADFLQLYGPTDWLETLAILESAQAVEAMEFAALLAVCAAEATRAPEPDVSEVDALLGVLSGNDASLAAAAGFSFQVALGQDNDDEFISLLIEVAAHERLSYYEQPSPGIAGLPLSATEEQWLDWQQIAQFFEGGRSEVLTDEEQVAIVRTLCDLRQWLERDPERFKDLANKAVMVFEPYDSRAVQLARTQLQAQLAGTVTAQMNQLDSSKALTLIASCADSSRDAIKRLHECCQQENVLGLECTRRLAEIGTPDALEALAELWASGPLNRAPFYKNALLAALEEQ